MSVYKNMIGYKIFKGSDLKEDKDINLFRITGYVKKPKSKSYVEIIDEDGVKSHLYTDELKEKYVPLTPDGYMTISVVSVTDQNNKMVKDIIVTASKILEIKVGITFPYAICRQSVNDIFADMYTSDSSTVGLAVNKDECPGGFDMGMLLACDKILEGISFNFYRNDTLDDILELIDTASFDYVLENLYNSYISYNSMTEYAFKDYCNGWCKNLKVLLQSNNFQSDIDQMLGITSVNFKLEDFIVEKDFPDKSKGRYTTVTDELKLWLSGTFKVIINDIYILEYYHDIDLSEFNNSLYLFLRDNTKKLYFLVYTINNERLLADLEDEYNKKDFSTQFRINFFNKYEDSI